MQCLHLEHANMVNVVLEYVVEQPKWYMVCTLVWILL